MKVFLKRSLVLILAVTMLFTSTTKSTANAATTGTKSSPYSLSLGTSKTVTISKGSTLWFEIKARGAINITVNGGTKPSDVTIYDKGLFSNEKIGNSLTTSSFDKVYQLYNNNTYLISVNNWSGSSYNITVKAALNQQRSKSLDGGTWVPNSDSAAPVGLICIGKYYIPKDAVAELYQAVNEDGYLNVIDKVLGMSLSAALTFIEPRLGIGTLTASVIYSAATSPISLSLVDLNLDSVKIYGGYNSSTKKYTKGICYSVYLTLQGYKVYTYSSWTDGIMYGQEGYTGSFISAKKN